MAALPGWEIDRDGWHRRRAREADYAFDFSNSYHAFIEDGWLYCRNGDQAEGLDNGIAP